MRPLGAGKKKLIVAFHFHFANQAAWKCDECRITGLDTQRRCGYLKHGKSGSAGPVWVRRRAVALACPKSEITADSAAWLDRYFVWKAGGPVDLLALPARTAEAFLILEREWRSELEHAEQRPFV
jgi:hypothetical protein